MSMTTLKTTPFADLKPLRLPSEYEKTQVIKKLEYKHTLKAIKTVLIAIASAGLCTFILDMLIKQSIPWYIAGILLIIVLMLFMISQFASLNAFSFIVDKARDGDFAVIDCTLDHLMPKLSSLSTEEHLVLNEVIHRALETEDYSELNTYSALLAKRKRRKYDAFVVTPAGQISVDTFEVAPIMADKYFADNTTEFFIARFSISDYEVMHMELFSK